jgi:hypothetical protein
MADLTRRRGLPLWSDHTRFLRRHRAVVEAAVGLGLLAGVAVGVLQPATWSATASVALAPIPVYVKTSAGELVPPEVSLDTDAQLLGSPEVLGAVGRELGVDVDEAADHLAVSASAQTRVLHITITASSAADAQAATSAAVKEFVALRGEVLGALGEEPLRELRLALDTRESELAQVRERRIVLDDDELFLEVLDLRAALDELEAAQAVPADVITPAEVPDAPDYANTEVPVVSGAGLGLLLGLLIALARDRRTPRRVLQRAGPASSHHSSTDHLPGDAPGPVTRHQDAHHAL